VHGREVSRHLAAIDVQAVPEPHRTSLATVHGDLRTSISALGWMRRRFLFGDTRDDRPILRALAPFAGDTFPPFSWRRYEVHHGGRLVAVVLEALTWRAWDHAKESTGE
jgi:hypothetical protein